MSGRPRPYKVLCVSSLHPKASDDVVRDTLYREYKKYGDISVRIVLEPDERVGYVYFRSFEDAGDARHSKSRIILFDKPAIVEPVYESRSEQALVRRQRSVTPPPTYSRYRSRSPVRSEYQYRDYREDYHYQPHYSSRGCHHEYHPRGELYTRGYRGRGSYNGERGRGGYNGDRGRGYYRGRGGDRHYEPRDDYKKERFPSYLTHIPPEDDPMATRTLFAGNLELNITEEEMKKIFGVFGNLVDVDIKRPPPGTGNAFAFVRYENLDMANRAKVELSGQFIGKFQCKIGYGKANPTPKVWVGGLGTWCPESLLWKEFDRFGAIKSIEYEKGDTHAYIVYEMVDAAQAAVQEMRGFPLGGPDKRLRIDFSDVDPISVAGEGSPPPEGKRSSFTRITYEDHSKGERYSGSRARSNSLGDDVRSRRDDVAAGAQTVSDICRRTAKVWDGGIILKNSLFPTRLHLIDGNQLIADSLKDDDDKNNLKITQRLRLDQSKLDDVTKRMSNASTHAVFLGVPASMSIEHASPDIQSRPLRNLISYLKQKEAAGVISMTYKDGSADDQQGVLYCFPPCEYATDLLHRNACDLIEDGKEDYLLVIVVCGSHA